MRQFLFGIQSISEAKNIFLHSILFLLNNTSLYTFIYYRAENPIRRVDTTEKVLILHKTVQGKAYLYVLHYYILYVKTVFQCPRRVGWGFLLIFSCDERISVAQEIIWRSCQNQTTREKGFCWLRIMN